MNIFLNFLILNPVSNNKKSWLDRLRRTSINPSSNATMWNPESEDDDVSEYHNPWLSLNQGNAKSDSYNSFI